MLPFCDVAFLLLYKIARLFISINSEGPPFVFRLSLKFKPRFAVCDLMSILQREL